MTEFQEDIEREVAEVLLRQGVVPAIVRYRALTGVSIRESRSAVLAIQLDTGVRAFTPSLPEDAERQVHLLLDQGEKIKAILIVRQALGIGLREGKVLVDQMDAARKASQAADRAEAGIRADERAKTGEAIARAIEGLIDNRELVCATRDAYSDGLRRAAQIARGE